MSIISSQLLFSFLLRGSAIDAELSTGWYLLMVYP